VIVERFGGKVPETPELIREIPGIGAYTAGAILSIAYGKREPLVDGNVIRVLSRLFLIAGDVKRTAAKAIFWARAKALVDALPARNTETMSPGNLNQGLMELGATICTPTTPVCERCPLASSCRARKKGLQASYPHVAQRAAVPIWNYEAGLSRTRRTVIARRRAERGLFGGLWELPTEANRIRRGFG